MRTTDLVLAAIPIAAGIILLFLSWDHLRFYSLESPYMWSFGAIGIGVGMIVCYLGERPKKTLLGVPITTHN